MRKIWLASVCAAMTAGAFFIAPVNAKSILVIPEKRVEAPKVDFLDGKQFDTLKRKATEEPQILEFFSFFCPHCYDFENVYHLNAEIKKQVPANGKMVQYHVDFLGGELGPKLTQAWAVAITLGVQDKVSPLIFNGIQKTQTIRTQDDIRQVFIAAGVTGEEFDSAWNSFIVKSLTAQQRRLAEEVELRSVPSVLVNGKYMVKNDGLDADSVEDFVQQYGQVVKYLLGKK
ncbi:MAG: thiol:disulfide interchange protein DsbA [Enterobacteriaceae bacterium]|jgi:thiol:disulfide interchange protein DsbA|nr:thiol:disulfide interchange protein DsbA [Enterobacteriaceae bacterium]